MHVTVAEALDRIDELIRLAEAGEPVVITRDGKPVVQITKAPTKREVIFGGMHGRIKLYSGWDDPIDEDAFLTGNF